MIVTTSEWTFKTIPNMIMLAVRNNVVLVIVHESIIRCFAMGRAYKIRRGDTCSTKSVIYIAYCFTCRKQGLGSTVSWKPRLPRYKQKSHIEHNEKSCKIACHFTKEFKGLHNLRPVSGVKKNLNNTEFNSYRDRRLDCNIVTRKQNYTHLSYIWLKERK